MARVNAIILAESKNNCRPRMAELYTRGPLIRSVLTGMYVLAAVMVEEIIWDCRYNPQWTRWWD